MEEIRNVTARFEVRSAIECAIICRWDSNCIVWQANIMNEKMCVFIYLMSNHNTLEVMYIRNIFVLYDNERNGC